MVRMARSFQFLSICILVMLSGCTLTSASNNGREGIADLDQGANEQNRATVSSDPVQIYLWIEGYNPNGALVNYVLKPLPGLKIGRYDTKLLIGTKIGQKEKIIGSSFHSVAFKSPISKSNDGEALTGGSLAVGYISIPDGIDSIDATALVFFNGAYVGPQGNYIEFGLAKPREFHIRLSKP